MTSFGSLSWKWRMLILSLPSSNQKHNGPTSRTRLPSYPTTTIMLKLWPLRMAQAIRWRWRSWIWLLSIIFVCSTLKRDVSCLRRGCWFEDYRISFRFQLTNSVLSQIMVLLRILCCPSRTVPHWILFTLEEVALWGTLLLNWIVCDNPMIDDVDLPSLSSFVIDDRYHTFYSFEYASSFLLTRSCCVAS